ncbi:MAG: hypothetical protein AAF846_17670 [Chloroflexota bacterium]
MPINMYWYIPDKIILIDMQGTVTENEFATMMTESLANQDNSYPVHSIVNTSNLDKHPEAVPSMKFMSKYMPKTTQPQWVMFTSSADGRLGKFIATVTMQILRQRFRFVDSLEEAIETLAQLDPELPKLPPIDAIESLDFISKIDDQTMGVS